MNAGRIIAAIMKTARLDWERYGHIEEKLPRGQLKSTDLTDAASMARKLGYDNPRQELEAFFESDYFKDLSRLANLEPDAIKRPIMGEPR